MSSKSTRRRGRFATATALAACGGLLAIAPAAAGAAASECGPMAMAQPFVDHLDSAHLQTSPGNQVKDLMHVDAYVLAHTVLIESMLAPLVPTIAGVEGPFVDHVDSAHLQTSPINQAKDLLKADDYVLAHTVLVASMLAPLASGTGCPGEEPAPAPPAAAAPGAPAAMAMGGHSTIDITMSGLAYSPAAITVAPGSTVKWTNMEDAPHTITSKGGGMLKSKTLQKGGSFSFQFATPGVYAYYCTVHPNMTGTVSVG
jgi:plastocyanin